MGGVLHRSSTNRTIYLFLTHATHLAILHGTFTMTRGFIYKYENPA